MTSRLQMSVVTSSIIFSGMAGLVRASDPTLVRPGDSVVNGSAILPYRNAWQYSTISVTGETELLGQWTDELSIVTVDTEEQIVRRQTFPTPAGPRVFVSRARRSDLAPRSFEITTSDGQLLQRIEFETTRLIATAAAHGDPMILPLTTPVFDWFLYGILVAGFPLEDGYAARFPVLSQTLEPVMRELRVVAREPVAGPDGSDVPCWRVETDDRLTFWIADSTPYILRAQKREANGVAKLWELETHVRYSNYLELRVYESQPGQRDNFLNYFEKHYLESQEATKMRIWGQFRDLDVDQHFVWLRGYRTMAERQRGLTEFYMGPVWAQTRPTLSTMFARVAKARFLEPLTPNDRLDGNFERVNNAHPPGVVVVNIFHIPEDPAPVTDRLRTVVIPAFVKRGAASLGIFRSSEEANNFPALPFAENERIVVWFSSFETASAYERACDNVPFDPAPSETLVLEPGQRSRIYHRADRAGKGP